MTPEEKIGHQLERLVTEVKKLTTELRKIGLAHENLGSTVSLFFGDQSNANSLRVLGFDLNVSHKVTIAEGVYLCETCSACVCHQKDRLIRWCPGYSTSVGLTHAERFDQNVGSKEAEAPHD